MATKIQNYSISLRPFGGLFRVKSGIYELKMSVFSSTGTIWFARAGS